MCEIDFLFLLTYCTCERSHALYHCRQGKQSITMRLLSRRTYLFMVVLNFLRMGTVCSAKKDRSPTMAPTKQSKDNGPMDGDAPIHYHPDPDNNSPISSPVFTISPAPTVLPTVSPNVSPTVSPSELADVEVKLAPFSLDTTTDGGQLDLKILESDLEDIMTNHVLQHFTYFAYVTLEATEVRESPPKGRRSLQEQNIGVDVSGSAWFTDESDLPSEDQLNEFVSTYFSISGSDDLTQRLHEGNPSIIMAMFVAPIDAGPSNATDKGVAGAETRTSSSSGLPVGAVAGLAVACAVLVFALGVFLWQMRRRKSSGEGVNVSMERKGTKTASTSSPTRTTSGTPDVDDDSFFLGEDEDISVDGASSMADSIYTSNSDLNFLKSKRKEPSLEGYDAKRLDLVIQSAQQFSADGSTKKINSPSKL